MSNDPEFRRMLAQRIQSYREHERQLDARLAELQAERESVARRRESAEELFQAEFGEAATDADAGSPAAKPVVEVGPLTGLSWAEAMTRVLSEAGTPLHVTEIWARLQAGGFRTDSRDPVRSIAAIAVRDPSNFPKAGPNRYGLAATGPVGSVPEGGDAKA